MDYRTPNPIICGTARLLAKAALETDLEEYGIKDIKGQKEPPFASILSGSDLDEPNSQRRVMAALHYFLTNNMLHPGTDELQSLRIDERTVVDRIVAAIRTSHFDTLLLEAVLLYLEANIKADAAVLDAAHDLAFLGPRDVLIYPGDHPIAHSKLREKFNFDRGFYHNLQAPKDILKLAAPAAFGPQLFATCIPEDTNTGKKPFILNRPVMNLFQVYPRQRVKKLSDTTCDACAEPHNGHACDREIPSCNMCTFAGRKCVYTPGGPIIPPVRLTEKDVAAKINELPHKLDLTEEERADRVLLHLNRVAEKTEAKKAESKPSPKESTALVVLPTRAKRAAVTSYKLRSQLSKIEKKSAENDGRRAIVLAQSECDLASGLQESDSPSRKSTPKSAVDLGTKKHTPIRTRGERAVDDGSYDRSTARVGQPDESKLTIIFKTEREDPKNQGQVIPGRDAVHRYLHNVDWNDKTSVYRLQQWRNQIFSRSISSQNASRIQWTLEERKYLSELCRESLASEKAGGRWGKIDWMAVTKAQNARFGVEVVHRNERALQSEYEGKSNLETSKSASVTARARQEGITRTYDAIKAQVLRFTDPESVAMKRKALDLDEAAFTISKNRKYKRPKKSQEPPQ